MDIDLVYLWVDGSDPKWQEKKKRFMNEDVAPDAGAKGRFFNNDELKFSLRSVEKFLPWIHHIFLVTDNQTPEWLNLNHPQITLVDHRDIIPEKYLPTFNSGVIEWFISEIQGLSEFFLYANDDFCFGSPCSPSLFFTKNGVPIEHAPRYRPYKSPLLWETNCRNAISLSLQKTGKEPVFRLGHTVASYRKSYFKETRQIFKNELEQSYSNHFRRKGDISRYLIPLMDVAMNRRIVKFSPKYFWEKPFKKFFYFDISEKLPGNLDRLRKKHYKMFCINDNENATDEQRKLVRRFFEEYFPQKSSFEK
jgi:hypothetical protein